MPSTETEHAVSHGADTREQILDAAERLIGDQGVDRASVRSITEAANANLAAVSYHFGSKNGLVREVFERRLRPINHERLRLLDACLEAGSPPDLECVVRAFVAPPFDVLKGDQATSFGRLMMRVLADPGPETRDLLMDIFREVIARFSEALRAALPHAEPAGVFWRFHFMIGAMAYTVGMGHLVHEYSRGICDPNDVEQTVERLIGFITAGLRAESPEATP